MYITLGQQFVKWQQIAYENHTIRKFPSKYCINMHRKSPKVNSFPLLTYSTAYIYIYDIRSTVYYLVWNYLWNPHFTVRYPLYSTYLQSISKTCRKNLRKAIVYLLADYVYIFMFGRAMSFYSTMIYCVDLLSSLYNMFTLCYPVSRKRA